MNDHDHDKYITTTEECNKLTADNFTPRLKQIQQAKMILLIL